MLFAAKITAVFYVATPFAAFIGMEFSYRIQPFPQRQRSTVNTSEDGPHMLIQISNYIPQAAAAREMVRMTLLLTEDEFSALRYTVGDWFNFTVNTKGILQIEPEATPEEVRHQ
jgi:hypothetical protein